MRLSDYLIMSELSIVIFWVYHVKEWQKNSPNLQTSRINYQFSNVHINFILGRDVTTRKILVRPCQWWVEFAPPGWNRVKVSENLGSSKNFSNKKKTCLFVSANPAHLPQNWAKLAALFSWQLQNGPKDFDFFNCRVCQTFILATTKAP